jgi:1-acyl-sn-glycerol-3-phosphate acyltransferase
MTRLELPENDIRSSLHYPLHETAFHKFIVWLARIVFSPFLKLHIYGLEHLPPAGGGIVAANHLGNFDVFPVQLGLPRMVFYMGKAELFQNAFIHYVFRSLGAFPVYRGERDQWALDHSRKILSSGQLLAMFPEGTRSRGKGLGLAKPGAAKLSIEMNVPIIVVSVDGIESFFKRLPRSTNVKLTIAPPIYPTEDDTPLSLTDKMMFTMAAGLSPELRGVYAELPKGFEDSAGD